MPIPLGILSAAGFIAPSGGSYDLLSTQILTSNQASVTFAGLAAFAANYEHLQIRTTCRTAESIGATDIVLQFNSDTTYNYSFHLLVGNGSAVNSFAGVNQSFIKGGCFASDSMSSAGTFGAGVTDILDAFNSSKFTTTRSLTGKTAPGNEIQLFSGSWRNIAPISSIRLFPLTATTLVTGSRFSVYGLRKV